MKKAIQIDASPNRLLDIQVELRHNLQILYFLVWRTLKAKYKQTIIGMGTIVIQPLISMVVFTVIFGKFAGLAPKSIPQPIFYFSGLIIWDFFSTNLTDIMNSLSRNKGIVTKIYFPRIILAFESTLTNLINLGISMIMLLILMLIYGYTPTLNILFLPVFLFYGIILSMGIGLIFAPFAGVFRDIRIFFPFVIRTLMFFSPVAYSAKIIDPNWKWLYDLNPITQLVEGFRWSILSKVEFRPEFAIAPVLVCIVIFLIGIFLFNRVESNVVDLI